MSDIIKLLALADQHVRNSLHWRRFIDGNPLSNDIAVWMADFARDHAKDLSADLAAANIEIGRLKADNARLDTKAEAERNLRLAIEINREAWALRANTAENALAHATPLLLQLGGRLREFLTAAEIRAFDNAATRDAQ